MGGRRKLLMLRFSRLSLGLLLAVSILIAPGTASGAVSYPWPGGSDSAGVAAASTKWYLAEGCTRSGFDTWLCVLNPGAQSANLNISFLTPKGNEFQLKAQVSALSRYTLNVADVVGEGKDVSTVIESDLPVVAERPMYFNYHGMMAGGSDSAGVAAASTKWYLAEGCTRSGFDTWLCVLNPGAQSANLNISFLTPKGNEFQLKAQVSALSRYTLNVADVVGEGKDVSTVIESDLPVVAERPMYFNYHGMMAGGSDSAGVAAASTKWYLAEGCTRSGFDTWLCVLNPGAQSANLNISFLTPKGNEFQLKAQVSALSRYTLNVADVVGEGKDVSTVIESDLPVVAERPMYFNYHGMMAGGSDSAGVAAASTKWYLAEGCTRSGFDTWLCVLNPGAQSANLNISFLTPKGNEFQLKAQVSALSRYTLNVADVVGEGKDVSTVIESDLPVVAERPMYFNYRSPQAPAPFDLANVNGLTLTSPINYQDTTGIMYHQASGLDSNNQVANAQALIPLGGCVQNDNPGAQAPGWTPARYGDPYYWIEKSRSRGTFSTTAVDVGSKAGCPVVSPVDGVVQAVGSYALYGAYPDQYLYIIPDGHPELRVVVLHCEFQVAAGARVEAGIDVVGHVRDLTHYFQNSLGTDYTKEAGNHAHLQVNRP